MIPHPRGRSRGARTPREADLAVAKWLRAQRKAAAKTQREVAAAVGVSTQQWGKYERGENRTSSGILDAACRFFGVSMESHGDIPRPAGFSEAGGPAYGSEFEADLASALAGLAEAIGTVQAVLQRGGRHGA